MIKHPSSRFCGIFGFTCFISGATLVAMEELTSFRDFILPLASIHPDQVQPWISAINTALLTLGTTLIVLRQRYVKVESKKQFKRIMEGQDHIKSENERQHAVVVDGQQTIKTDTERKYKDLMEENGKLKEQIITLNHRIEALVIAGCDIEGCALRSRPKAVMPEGPSQGQSTSEPEHHA